MVAWCCSLSASCSPVWTDKTQINFYFFLLSLWADLGEQHGSLCLFLAEVPSQALTTWVWLTVGCCVLQADPKPKCSLSSATCCSCRGAAGHQGMWECCFSGAACTLLPAPWYNLPPLAAPSTLSVTEASYDFWYFHSLQQIRELGKEKSEAREVRYVGRKLNSHERDIGHHLQRVFLRHQQLW